MIPVKRCEFVTIYCADLVASRKFYVETLGFPVIHEMEGSFFQIDVAGVPICVDHDPRGGHSNNLGVEVDDLDAVSELLRDKGFEPRSGSNDATGEAWLEITDPDGNDVIFLTHVTRKRAP